jgi:hypothetical protein
LALRPAGVRCWRERTRRSETTHPSGASQVLDVIAGRDPAACILHAPLPTWAFAIYPPKSGRRYDAPRPIYLLRGLARSLPGLKLL